jgi:hypothetical protein
MLKFLFEAVLSINGIFLKCKKCHSFKMNEISDGRQKLKDFLKFKYQVHHYVRPFNQNIFVLPEYPIKGS